MSLRHTINWLFGPKSKFSVNEAVVLKAGGNEMMVITRIICHPSKDPSIVCQWQEPGGTKKEGTFDEGVLKPFNWYASMPPPRSTALSATSSGKD